MPGDNVRGKFGRQPFGQKAQHPWRAAKKQRAGAVGADRGGSKLQSLPQDLGTSMRVSRSDIYGYGHACHSSSLSTRAAARLHAAQPSVAYVCGAPHTSESPFLLTTFLSALRTPRPRSAPLDTLTCA
jgi:hypothetical protein